MPGEVIVPRSVASEHSAPTRFVGRQPILDRKQQVLGYELLFRSGQDNLFNGDSNNATRQMIDNVLFLGMETLTPGGKIFVNCTREALTERLVTFLPAESTVLEVLETIAVDDEVVASCRDLKKLGYQIALDDFVPGRGSDRLIEHANYVKLDLRACDTDQIRQIQRHLKGANVSLIAEKVETREEFQRSLEDGFQCFQGYFFAQPCIMKRREIPRNQLLYIQLLTAISRPDVDLNEIEKLVSAEASLCFRLLRLVNSANVAVRGHITSVRQALLMVGQDQLRKMVTVAGATSFGKRFNMSPELILLSLMRARFCELLAPAANQLAGEQYLIGLLSAFDAILQISMENLLKLLPLRLEAADALRGGDGAASVPLRLMRCYEQGQWEDCAAFCSAMRLSEENLTSIYVASLQWATNEVRDACL